VVFLIKIIYEAVTMGMHYK